MDTDKNELAVGAIHKHCALPVSACVRQMTMDLETRRGYNGASGRYCGATCGLDSSGGTTQETARNFDTTFG
jgi:hypothetical protein